MRVLALAIEPRSACSGIAASMCKKRNFIDGLSTDLECTNAISACNLAAGEIMAEEGEGQSRSAGYATRDSKVEGKS